VSIILSTRIAVDPASLHRTRRSHRSPGTPSPPPPSDGEILIRAEKILLSRLRSDAVQLSDPQTVAAYFKVRIGALEYEQFEALWLDSQHRVLQSETLARGTINEASVYPREVIKSALRFNAAAVIFAHNHPSGMAEPSWADRALTRRLKDALALIDIRALDHIVVGGNNAISFAERGWL
jgi:DNA repair protein RadC